MEKSGSTFQQRINKSVPWSYISTCLADFIFYWTLH